MQLLSYLLNSGADVDSGSIDGRTALHDAASSGQEAACKVLLKHNASLSTRDHEGHSPADLAQLKDLPGLEKLLRPTLDTEARMPLRNFEIKELGLTLLMKGRTYRFSKPHHIVCSFFGERDSLSNPSLCQQMFLRSSLDLS